VFSSFDLTNDGLTNGFLPPFLLLFQGLEKHILPKYFRHSNYSSFQRQMNYFGFRKIAGKGKMAACSYVNENATEDISSLLYIKRKKTGVSGTAAKLLAQANKMNRSQASLGLDNPMGMGNMMMMGGMNPMVMNGLGGNTMGGMMGLNQAQQLALLQQQNSGLLGGAMGLGGLQGMGMMGGNAINGLPNMGGASSLGDSARLLELEQQKIISQLQQAHAMASNGLNGSAMGNTISNPQFKNNFGINGLQGTAPILTNDQGNLYSSANPQALLMQQAAAMGGLGSFPQGSNAANSKDKALDSANFRSFLNSQIAMSNAAMTRDASSMGLMPQGMSSPQMTSNLPQGLSYEQFCQLSGMSTGATVGGEAQQFFQRNA
jgi:hypothetical protein